MWVTFKDLAEGEDQGTVWLFPQSSILCISHKPGDAMAILTTCDRQGRIEHYEVNEVDVHPNLEAACAAMGKAAAAGGLRTCRVCGCTDDDCSQCVEKTGMPCSWVEDDLCSACAHVDDNVTNDPPWCEKTPAEILKARVDLYTKAMKDGVCPHCQAPICSNIFDCPTCGKPLDQLPKKIEDPRVPDLSPQAVEALKSRSPDFDPMGSAKALLNKPNPDAIDALIAEGESAHATIAAGLVGPVED